MKTRVIASLILFGAVLYCYGFGKPPGRGRPKPVQIDEHFIFIPGTTISEEDQKATREVLAKYPKSLYRIQAYEKGVPKRPIGRMREMEIGSEASEAQRFAKSAGLTTWTTKIGLGCNVTRCPVPNPSPSPHVPEGKTVNMGSGCNVTRCPVPTATPYPDKPGKICSVTCNPPRLSDELVKEVTPILEKYSK